MILDLIEVLNNKEYFKNATYLSIERLSAPLTENCPHVEFLVAFCAPWQGIWLLLYCYLAPQTVKAVYMKAWELEGLV